MVTLLAGKPAATPNQFLVAPGERGVQEATLDPGTYYLNPYETRVSLVDCRSKRFNLAQEGVMDFLSSDGALDADIHASREQFKYFYDEKAPASVLAGMEEASKKLR